MNILTDKLEYSYFERDKKIVLNTDCKTVFKYLRLIKDKRLDNEEKFCIIMQLFLNDQKISDLDLFYNNVLNLVSCNTLNENNNNIDKNNKNITDSDNSEIDTESTKQIVDFDKDASYIYASFIQAYNIDLIKDNIHWCVFRALFDSLPKETKMSEIMDIRVKKVPQLTKYNQEEVRQLKKAKRIYSLDEEEEPEVTISRALNSLREMVVSESGRRNNSDNDVNKSESTTGTS